MTTVATSPRRISPRRFVPLWKHEIVTCLIFIIGSGQGEVQSNRQARHPAHTAHRTFHAEALGDESQDNSSHTGVRVALHTPSVPPPNY